jgi:hypothetical protein
MKLLYYRCTDSFWPGCPGALVVTDLWLAVLFDHITVATFIAQQLSSSHSQIPCFPGLRQVTNINTTNEYAGGSGWEGRAWSQLVRCAPYPSTCPKFLNEVQRTSNKVQLNSEGKATLMKVPIGLPEVAWESLDMISGLWELVRKHIWSMGTKSGRTSGNRKTM